MNCALKWGSEQSVQVRGSIFEQFLNVSDASIAPVTLQDAKLSIKALLIALKYIRQLLFVVAGKIDSEWLNTRLDLPIQAERY